MKINKEDLKIPFKCPSACGRDFLDYELREYMPMDELDDYYMKLFERDIVVIGAKWCPHPDCRYAFIPEPDLKYWKCP